MSEDELKDCPEFIKSSKQWAEIVGLLLVHKNFSGLKETFIQNKEDEYNEE